MDIVRCMPAASASTENGRERPVSLPADAIRKRLRLVATAVVLVVAAGVAYDFKSTPPTYLESAAVIFNLPRYQTAPRAYVAFAPSLITSGDAMTKILESPQAQRHIREAGGTADVGMQLTNLYNQEYPDYGEPLAMLTTASQSPADVHRTFVIAARLLDQLLAARQAQAGVSPGDRIFAQIIGDTGPIVQAGSPKRALAGLALLTVVGAAMGWSLIDWVIGWRDQLMSALRGRRPDSVNGDIRSSPAR
jgi:hypothetical protein